MRQYFLFLMIILTVTIFIGCEETDEGVDAENDIIVRNVSEFVLWFTVDGVQRGHVDNDGTGVTIWDDIPDGVHELKAFYDNGYTDEHCDVMTDYLNDGEDFFWYLEDNFEYTGSKHGDC